MLKSISQMSVACVLLIVFPSAAFAANGCQFQIDSKASVIEATGYKFTEKKGVTAKILGVETSAKKAASIKDLFKNLDVTVDLMSLDSGNTLRDNNIREQLLASLKDEAVVKVHMKSFTKDKWTVALKVNGVEKDVIFKVSQVDDKGEPTFTGTSVVNGLDYMMKPGLAALAKRCQSLHTGSDGVSKTWSDFGLKVVLALKRICS